MMHQSTSQASARDQGLKSFHLRMDPSPDSGQAVSGLGRSKIPASVRLPTLVHPYACEVGMESEKSLDGSHITRDAVSLPRISRTANKASTAHIPLECLGGARYPGCIIRDLGPCKCGDRSCFVGTNPPCELLHGTNLVIAIHRVAVLQKGKKAALLVTALIRLGTKIIGLTCRTRCSCTALWDEGALAGKHLVKRSPITSVPATDVVTLDITTTWPSRLGSGTVPASPSWTSIRPVEELEWGRTQRKAGRGTDPPNSQTRSTIHASRAREAQ
jgi:hypothetical protein